MIRHVNAVIAVDCHKQAGDDKGDRVFLCTPVLHYVREHRQGEHHAGNGHVTAGPAFEITRKRPVFMKYDLVVIRFHHIYDFADLQQKAVGIADSQEVGL